MKSRRLGCVSLLLALLLLGGCASQQKLTPEQISSDVASISRQQTLAVLGGTGMVGGHILQLALEQGYPLRVLSRSPEKLAYLGDRITIINGDARDPAVINQLLKGSHVVISALGPGKNAPPDLTTAVSRNVLKAMRAQGVSRYLVVSGAGVVTPLDQRNFTGWSTRQMARVRYPKLLRDRQNEYSLIAASEIHWTVARCPLIDSGFSHQAARTSLTSPEGFRVKAGALARFLLNEVAEPTYVQQAPFVFGGSR